MNLNRKVPVLSRAFLIAIVSTVMCAGLLAGRPVTDQHGDAIGEIGKRLDEYFTSIAASDFSGVALVAKNGEELLSKGYGAANREKRIPFTSETVFDIGSITKQFTTAAILKLEMQGRLRVTDTIGKYIPGVPPDKAGITIHQLLTHSAGLVNNLGNDYMPLKRGEFIKLSPDSKLQFAPRASFGYSNVGYGLLGAIIEIVTDQSYERYLYDNLFTPAGLTTNGYKIPKWNPDKLAVGYYKEWLVWAWGTPLDKAWDSDGPYWNMRACQGMLSMVGDLYKWHRALGGEKVLSREAKEKLFTPYIVAEDYGYGWVISKSARDTRVIWHSGGNKIFNAYFRRYVDEGVVVIIATNYEPHQAKREIGRLEELIFGKN